MIFLENCNSKAKIYREKLLKDTIFLTYRLEPDRLLIERRRSGEQAI